MLSAYLRLSRALDEYWRKPWLYFTILTILAAATVLTFAPYYQFWLMPLLFGALIRLFELKPQRMVSSAYWFGLVAYSTQFWWVHTALHDVSGLPNLYALPLTILLPAFLACFPMMTVVVWRWFHLPRWMSVGVVLPLLWTVAEFARERAFTGFGWGALGYSQIADDSPLAGFAPLAGIHAVTLATAIMGAWLVLFINNTRRREQFAAICVVATLLGTGSLLRQQEFTQALGEPVSVALAQGNIPQQVKFDAQQTVATYERYYTQVAQTRAQIVVLPETALPQFLQNIAPEILAEFAQVARRNGSALAVGVPAFNDDGTGYLNAMVDLTHFDASAPYSMPLYAKNHLVPFGEYKPLPELTEPLYHLMNMPLADFQRGGVGQKPFDMAGQKVAFNICYEDGFGDELIASARQATLLANASNMAWYGHSNAMWQQLQQSQARALELGRPMLRATNTGATAIVSHQGRVLLQAAPNVATVLEGKVQGRTGETPYMRMGNSWYLIGAYLVILAILWCAGSFMKRKK